MQVLAFDLGGSGAKLLLGHFNGKTIDIEEIIKFEHRPYP
jgi:sugar (pentulose or hexulose) kinase